MKPKKYDIWMMKKLLGDAEDAIPRDRYAVIGEEQLSTILEKSLVELENEVIQ